SVLRGDSAMRQIPENRPASKKHLTLSTARASLFSLAVFILGVVFSIDRDDWSWFARSGSIIVVIGIFLTSSQIIENSRRLRTRRHRHRQNFHRDYAEEIKRATLERSRSLDEDIWENGLRGLYLLVIGTLIWGFGDLAGYFF
ncbi:MAG: hypothetical protein WBN36_03070, partial [Gammaproteobacteria bacterium]